MTYFGFLARFLLPPLALVGILTLSDLVRRRPFPPALRGGSPWIVLLAHVAVALIYTTPWDNYLVATGVWAYNPDLVTGVTLGWVPIEEYTFFVLQTLLSGLWVIWLARRLEPAPLTPFPRWAVTAPVALLWLGSLVLLLSGWDPGTYLALTLVWALPPIALQLAFGAGILWRHRRLVALALLLPLLYLSVGDGLAIGSGTWTIAPAQSLQVYLGGVLPVEEFVFFLVTNVLIVFGMTLMLATDSLDRVPPRARPRLARLLRPRTTHHETRATHHRPQTTRPIAHAPLVTVHWSLVAVWLLYQDWLRRPVVRLLDRWLRARSERDHPTWRAIERQRRLIYSAVLHTVDRVIGRRLLSPQVARVIARLWGRTLSTPPGKRPATRRFRAEHGADPPWFLVISPTQACNLHCTGCYADSGPSDAHLDWATLDRVMTEAKELWGAPLFVLSGGEPLTYRSEGRDILDMVEQHADCLFLMFTNGTLIDRATAQRLARLGNLTPALSVEGMCGRTDERRGPGAFDRVLRAMAELRQAGVPFGVSITATRENCEEILSDEFLDFFFDEQGAFYGFIFQYTPIGRGCHMDWLPTAEQATAFWRRSWEVVEKRHLFLLDFWNHGPLVEGCISAGRDRGYLYVDWNGKVMPCVFAPYAACDVHQVYAQGGNLNDVWAAPFFAAIRGWQREHGYGGRELTAENNWLRPCPFRDHHAQFREWVARYGPQPADEAAAAALTDESYREQMVAYGQQQRACGQELWEQEYLHP